jgi:hypothetical protein
LLFLVRASLARFIEGGSVLRLLGTISAVAAVVVFAAGGWQLYSWAALLIDKLH